MEQKHQFLIKSNHTTLVKKIMTSSVVGHLFVSNIITDEMRQQIEAEKNSYDTNRKLLNIIIPKGLKAFRGFRMALMMNNKKRTPLCCYRLQAYKLSNSVLNIPLQTLAIVTKSKGSTPSVMIFDVPSGCTSEIVVA